MKKFLIILPFIVTIYGCEKDNSVFYSTSLIGEWSWYISCGGVVGCIGPSENNSLNLLFTVDSVLYTYRNDTMYSYNIFHTYKRISDDCMDTTNILKYGTAIQEYWIYQDTLYLQSVNLMMGSGYKRIKQKHFPLVSLHNQ